MTAAIESLISTLVRQSDSSPQEGWRVTAAIVSKYVFCLLTLAILAMGFGSLGYPPITDFLWYKIAGSSLLGLFIVNSLFFYYNYPIRRCKNDIAIEVGKKTTVQDIITNMVKKYGYKVTLKSLIESKKLYPDMLKILTPNLTSIVSCFAALS